MLERLNMIDKLRGSHFVKKYSVQFIIRRKAVRAVLFLGQQAARIVADVAGAAREFDKMLLENAREHGVDVQEGVRVLEVLFEGQRAVGVRDSGRRWHAARRAGRCGRRCQRAKLDDHEPAGIARMGSRAEEGGAVDVLEGANAIPAKTKARRWSFK